MEYRLKIDGKESKIKLINHPKEIFESFSAQLEQDMDIFSKTVLIESYIKGQSNRKLGIYL